MVDQALLSASFCSYVHTILRTPAMQPTLTCTPNPALPCLAWIASVDLKTGATRALHGPGVETRRNWLVEGVWDGDFEAGAFHESECFFGSGVRIAGDRVYFVPSIALTDRLVYASTGEQLHVSNSLPLLMSSLNATLDPLHSYVPEATFLAPGLTRRDRMFRLLHPAIHTSGQFNHERLVVQLGEYRFEPQTEAKSFDCFSDYYSALQAALQEIASNARDSRRANAIQGYTTASAGYDSSCISALVRDLGVGDCFTRQRSNATLPAWLSPRAATDDGTPIASHLGYRVHRLNAGREAQREVVFRAVSRVQPELAFDALMNWVEGSGSLGVLYTGFYGDTMWGLDGDRDAAAELGWRLGSGLSLGEVRLHAGVIHAAVPFLFARSGASITRISRSAEMRPWRLGTEYDRPIPRRILEDAGVPRNAFGNRKRAILNLETMPVSPSARRALFEWVRMNTTCSPLQVVMHGPVNRAAFLARGTIDAIRDRLRGTQSYTPRNSVWADIDPDGLMFRWAVATLVDHYARLLESPTSVTHVAGV